MNFFQPNLAAFSDINSLPERSETPSSEPELEQKPQQDLDEIHPFFRRIPEIPTQKGPEGSGITFDFNFGCRISLPPGDWHVVATDAKSGHVFGNTLVAKGLVESQFKYFIPFNFIVLKDGQPVIEHQMDLRDKPVLISIANCALGDVMAWFPALVRFQQLHQCHLTCWVDARFHELLVPGHPEIRFINHEQQDDERYYASYYMNAAMGNGTEFFCPADGQRTALHHIASAILGLAPDENPAQITLADNSRPIEEPYVCIAVQSTAMCKFWNNPIGWITLVSALKSRGYRVICIDQRPVTGAALSWNTIPNGAEDQTGDRPLSERLRWLRHAEFFVGLSSGLSWLAWTAGIPVVMISGFSDPLTEFPTPYRVINRYVCNSCWNDKQFLFDRHDFFWCPRHKGTPNHFICSKAITPEQVLNTIATIPGLSF